MSSLPILTFDERVLNPRLGYVFDRRWLDPYESIVGMLVGADHGDSYGSEQSATDPEPDSSLARRADNRRCRPGRRDLADRRVVDVSDMDVARGIDRDTFRWVEPRRTARAIGAARDTRLLGKRSDDTGGRDLADRIVAGVGDIDVARGIDGGAARRAEAGDGPVLPTRAAASRMEALHW